MAAHGEASRAEATLGSAAEPLVGVITGAGLALGALYLVAATVGLTLPQLGPTLDVATSIVHLVVPIAFVFGLLRVRLDHLGISGLVLELGRPPSPAHLEQVLARSLHDPSLRILRWSAGRSSWVSADGRDCELPAGGGRHQTTVLRRHHEPVAALVHDPSLSEEADLLAAVSSATLLAWRKSGCGPRCRPSSRR